MSQGLATRKTLARLRLCRMHMRKEGKLVLQGKQVTNAASTDIRKTWAMYDYTPPSELRE